MTHTQRYVHGYSSRESRRLNDQAGTLEALLHGDTVFPQGNLVLEAGCGVGAQTKIVAAKNPGARFVSVDLSETSARRARSVAAACCLGNTVVGAADIFKLPFADATFDAVLVCFVLEHLSRPVEALIELRRVLVPGGTLMAIEGDHGSTFFHPHSEYACRAIDCQVTLQRRSGGNSNIGRELYPLLAAAGFSRVTVSPRMVYVDAGRPELVEGFTKNTFTAMIEGVGEEAVRHGLIDKAAFDRGIQDLYRTAEKDGVFCYTFFKGSGIKR